MEILRAFIYSLAIFASLAILALLVAGIMIIIYSVVHRGEKKTVAVAKAAGTGTSGKAG